MYYSANYNNIIDLDREELEQVPVSYRIIKKGESSIQDMVMYAGKLWENLPKKIDLSEVVREDLSLENVSVSKLSDDTNQHTIMDAGLFQAYELKTFSAESEELYSQVFNYHYDFNTDYIPTIEGRKILNDPINYNWVPKSIRAFSIFDADNPGTGIYVKDKEEEENPVPNLSTSLQSILYIKKAADDATCMNFEYDKYGTRYLQLNYSTPVKNCNAKYELIYVNKYGGVDTLLLLGKCAEKYNYNSYRIDTNYNRSDPSSHQYKTIRNTAVRQFDLNTGWLNDDETSRIDHLLLSPKIWLYDMEEYKIYACYFTNTSFDIKKYKHNRKLINYSLSVKIAQDIIRLG